MKKKQVMALILTGTLLMGSAPVGVLAEEVQTEVTMEEEMLFREAEETAEESMEDAEAYDMAGCDGEETAPDALLPEEEDILLSDDDVDGLVVDDTDAGEEIEEDDMVLEDESEEAQSILNEADRPVAVAMTATKMSLMPGQQAVMQVRTISSEDFTVSYTWSKSAYSGPAVGHSATLTVTPEKVYEEYYCDVIFTDRKNPSVTFESVISFEVNVPDWQPEEATVTLSNGESEGDGASAAIGVPVTYMAEVYAPVSVNDGEQLTYKYEWSVGSKTSTETSSSAISSFTYALEENDDETLSCEVTVTDEKGVIVSTGTGTFNLSPFYTDADSLDTAAQIDMHKMSEGVSVLVNHANEVYLRFLTGNSGLYTAYTEDENVPLTLLDQDGNPLPSSTFTDEYGHNVIYMYLAGNTSYYLEADTGNYAGDAYLDIQVEEQGLCIEEFIDDVPYAQHDEEDVKVNVPVELSVKTKYADNLDISYAWTVSDRKMNETGSSITIMPNRYDCSYQCSIHAVDKTNPAVVIDDLVSFYIAPYEGYSGTIENAPEIVSKEQPFTLHMNIRRKDGSRAVDPAVTWSYVWTNVETGEVLPSNGASCTINYTGDANQFVEFECEAVAYKNGKELDGCRAYAYMWVNEREKADSIDHAENMAYRFAHKISADQYESQIILPAQGTVYLRVLPRISGQYRYYAYPDGEELTTEEKAALSYTYTFLNASGEEITTPITGGSMYSFLALEKGHIYYLKITNETAIAHRLYAQVDTENALETPSPAVEAVDEKNQTPSGEKQSEKPEKQTETEKPVTQEKPYLTLNVKGGASLAMKTGQKSSAVHVKAMTEGDVLTGWSSSKASVVSVSVKGEKITLKAKKKGTAKITLVTKKGAAVTFIVKVSKKTVKTRKVAVDTKTVILKKGQKYQLKVDATPVTTQQKVTYQSANKKIVTVSGKGLVRARKKGTAVVTVKSGKKKAKVKIVVK